MCRKKVSLILLLQKHPFHLHHDYSMHNMARKSNQHCKLLVEQNLHKDSAANQRFFDVFPESRVYSIDDLEYHLQELSLNPVKFRRFLYHINLTAVHKQDEDFHRCQPVPDNKLQVRV